MNTNKQTQGKLFKYLRQPKRIYTRVADVCLHRIRHPTIILETCIIALPPSNPQSIEPASWLWRVSPLLLLSSYFILQVRSAELSSAVQETREWNPGNFNISHCRHLRRLRLRRVPITGECQESNFVSASSQLPIDYWHWPTPGTFIIQSHQTEMGLLLLNSPRIVCAYLLAAAKVDSWASMYCRYLQNNLIFLHTAL